MKTDNLSAETKAMIKAEHRHHKEIDLFGFWIYLMSDLVIFSVLFATFVVLQNNYAGAAGPKELFEMPFLFVETMLLLLSSVTYGFSVIAMNDKKKNQAIIGLVVTALLGLGFVGMEIYEFAHMIAEGHSPDKSGFLSAFFTLVATHGAHVSFGLLWMFVLIFQIVKQGLTDGVCSRLMRLSLFWHFLDVVWVGVFTVVYLMGLV